MKNYNLPPEVIFMPRIKRIIKEPILPRIERKPYEGLGYKNPVFFGSTNKTVLYSSEEMKTPDLRIIQMIGRGKRICKGDKSIVKQDLNN